MRERKRGGEILFLMQKFGINSFVWEREGERNWVLHDQTLNVHIDFIAVIVVGACTLCYLEFLFEEPSFRCDANDAQYYRCFGLIITSMVFDNIIVWPFYKTDIIY